MVGLAMKALGFNKLVVSTAFIIFVSPAQALRVCDGMQKNNQLIDPTTRATELAITNECLAELGYVDGGEVCTEFVLACVKRRGVECASIGFGKMQLKCPAVVPPKRNSPVHTKLD
jgi:hypothetical protein